MYQISLKFDDIVVLSTVSTLDDYILSFSSNKMTYHACKFVTILIMID